MKSVSFPFSIRLVLKSSIRVYIKGFEMEIYAEIVVWQENPFFISHFFRLPFFLFSAKWANQANEFSFEESFDRMNHTHCLCCSQNMNGLDSPKRFSSTKWLRNSQTVSVWIPYGNRSAAIVTGVFEENLYRIMCAPQWKWFNRICFFFLLHSLNCHIADSPERQFGRCRKLIWISDNIDLEINYFV